MATKVVTIFNIRKVLIFQYLKIIFNHCVRTANNLIRNQ